MSYKYLFLIRFEDPLEPVPEVDAFMDITGYEGWTREKVKQAVAVTGLDENEIIPTRGIAGLVMRAKFDGKILDYPFTVSTDFDLTREVLQVHLRSLSKEALKKFISEHSIRL